MCYKVKEQSEEVKDFSGAVSRQIGQGSLLKGRYM